MNITLGYYKGCILFFFIDLDIFSLCVLLNFLPCKDWLICLICVAECFLPFSFLEILSLVYSFIYCLFSNK